MIEFLTQAAQTKTDLTPVIITASITLVVGVIAGAVATTTGLLGRRTEREKLAHDKEKFAVETRDKVKEDFAIAVESMAIVGLRDADLTSRNDEARKALKALLSISFMMPGVGGRHLEQMLDELQQGDVESLDNALDQWPNVSAAIRRKPPDPAPERRRFRCSTRH